MRSPRTLGLAVRRFFMTALRLRCPVCGGGAGARFERGDYGNWFVAAPLNYFVNALVCTTLTTFLVRRYGFFDGLALVVVGAALLAAALLISPDEGAWAVALRHCCLARLLTF